MFLAARPRPARRCCSASHSDSQPTGGWLDGALGVIYGLEVARALAERTSATAHLAVDAVSRQDEESRFFGCLGSRSFVGQVDDAALAEITDRDGVSLAAARAAAGLADVARQQVEPGRHIGFLEAHIERGPHLDKAGLKIGVVEAIVALRGLLLRFPWPAKPRRHGDDGRPSRRRQRAP